MGLRVSVDWHDKKDVGVKDIKGKRQVGWGTKV